MGINVSTNTASNKPTAKISGNATVSVTNNSANSMAVTLRAGNNIRQAAFGMAVYCSHGRERTHIDGLDATARLIAAYVLDI